MTFDPTLSIIAVDGGGTRCRFALAQGTRRIEIETGPANVSSDFDGSLQEIQSGLQQLAAAADLPLAALADTPAYLGLAGVISPEIAQRLGRTLPLVQCRIEDDRASALRGALGDADGAIAHCGTGSFLASQISGQRRIVGGWGAVLGDEASAQWLGRRALSACLEVVDGLAPAGSFSDEILAQFGSAAKIVAFAAQASPAEVGGLAPQVTRAAATGDPLACAVLQAGADDIAARLPKIGWRPQMRLCLTGGLAPHYAPFLSAKVQMCLTPASALPLDGALALAKDYAQEISRQPTRDVSR